MRSEAGKVVSRRFASRIVESGLLILAVALGVGAASSGFSLLANTLKAGGFLEVSELQGGLSAWTQAGMPTEK